ncbi:MAG: diacylglycerol kinase family protein [Eubacteriales bacterium]|nr:diacylglycerol kinase family protein [Christensenellaceae bacterium]MEA5064742.1 diacylglycerol kinase family protein [Eubacteriales bacterium]
MMIRVIVNPAAGRGKPLKLLGAVCAELEKRALNYIVTHSERAGHVTELAREAGQATALLVMGGDGTLSEVVSGLNGRPARLYLVPSGTGNDFVKTLRLPRDPLAALRAQLDGSAAPIDLPQLNGRAFLNVAGTGFDVDVVRKAERYKQRFSGLMTYLLGLIQAIRHFKPIAARITIDGVTCVKQLTIIEVANGRYFGGGMKVAPDADPSDGLLDLVYVDAVKRWQIWLLLPLFIPGWFTHLPITHHARVSALTIESEGMTMIVDGELYATDRAEFGILPGRISVCGSQ